MRAPALLFAACLAAACLASAAAAQTPLDAEAFERHVTGRTLTYSADGLPYGIEQYLEGRQVIWSFLDGDCQKGTWYPAGEMICFGYESYPSPQCWTFFLDGGGLVARFEDGPDLIETGEVAEAPLCLGPVPGV